MPQSCEDRLTANSLQPRLHLFSREMGAVVRIMEELPNVECLQSPPCEVCSGLWSDEDLTVIREGILVYQDTKFAQEGPTVICMHSLHRTEGNQPRFSLWQLVAATIIPREEKIMLLPMHSHEHKSRTTDFILSLLKWPICEWDSMIAWGDKWLIIDSDDSVRQESHLEPYSKKFHEPLAN